jgi:hypothetical protein
MLAVTCNVIEEDGRPFERERRLKLEIQGGRWQTYPILQIRYEQHFWLTEELVFHAATTYILDATYAQAAPSIRSWWRSRGLEFTADGEHQGELVEREAGVESIRPLGRQTVFATEFYE